MIIRKDDLTAESIAIGLWETLLTMAGVEPTRANEEIDLEIKKVVISR